MSVARGAARWLRPLLHGTVALACLVAARCAGPEAPGGAAAPPPASPSPSAPPPAGPSFDGRYEGTVHVAGGAVGMDLADCAPDPRLAVEVRDNRFRYVQRLPRLAASGPELARRASPTYVATIRPDGAIVGRSDDTNTTLVGSVAGDRMSGEIFGLLCNYAFTAERR